VLAAAAQPTKSFSLPLGEGLVGVDVSASSSANPQAEFLALGIIDIPIGGIGARAGKDALSDTKHQWWLSGQLGLKGMAQPGAVSGAASPGYYATAVNATPDKIVQSVDMSVHLGWQLNKPWPLPSSVFTVGQNPDPNKHEVTFVTLSFIAGGGAITPLSVTQSSPQVFEATPLILQNEHPVSPSTSYASSCSANPTLTPTCFVTFTPKDRTHFYRSYDVGMRLKLYGQDFTNNEFRFPAILDFTLGQNEYVTGGMLRGVILHVGGSFPIPYAPAGFFGFGSMDLGLSSSEGSGPQLQLIPAPVTTGLTATSPSVYTILTSQPNRDRYQFGFGIDIVHFLSSYFNNKNKNSSSTD
jgi:hypothetical protein